MPWLLGNNFNDHRRLCSFKIPSACVLGHATMWHQQGTRASSSHHPCCYSGNGSMRGGRNVTEQGCCKLRFDKNHVSLDARGPFVDLLRAALYVRTDRRHVLLTSNEKMQTAELRLSIWSIMCASAFLYTWSQPGPPGSLQLARLLRVAVP